MHQWQKFGENPSTDTIKLPRESRTDGRTHARTHARTAARTTWKHIASAGAYQRRRLKNNISAYRSGAATQDRTWYWRNGKDIKYDTQELFIKCSSMHQCAHGRPFTLLLTHPPHKVLAAVDNVARQAWVVNTGDGHALRLVASLQRIHTDGQTYTSSTILSVQCCTILMPTVTAVN